MPYLTSYVFIGVGGKVVVESKLKIGRVLEKLTEQGSRGKALSEGIRKLLPLRLEKRK